MSQKEQEQPNIDINEIEVSYTLIQSNIIIEIGQSAQKLTFLLINVPIMANKAKFIQLIGVEMPKISVFSWKRPLVTMKHFI